MIPYETTPLNTYTLKSSFFFLFFHTFFLLFFIFLSSNTFLILLLTRYKASTSAIILYPLISFFILLSTSIIFGYLIFSLFAFHHAMIVSVIILFFIGIYIIAKAHSLDSSSLYDKVLRIIRKEVNVLKAERNDIDARSVKPLTIIDECATEESKSEINEPLLMKSKFCNTPRITVEESRNIENILLIKSYTDAYQLIDKDLEWNLLKNVFICETFSKTQIGIIILSVIYNSMGAFMGGLLSFVFLLSLLALKGEFISKIINEQTMMYTSGFFLIVFSIEILYYNY